MTDEQGDDPGIVDYYALGPWTDMGADVLQTAALEFAAEAIGAVFRTKNAAGANALIAHVPADVSDPRLVCSAWMDDALRIADELRRGLARRGVACPPGAFAIGIAAQGPGSVLVFYAGDDSGSYGVLAVVNDGHFQIEREPVCGRCPGCVSRRVYSPQAAANWVYFIRCGDAGPIKIGRSASVRERLSDLQTANHEELRVIARIPGGPIVERTLHTRFAADRIRGEWFRPTDELLRLVAELRG